MELSTILQIINVILVALFGTAGWRMVDEWRKSREERHKTELKLCEQQIENLKVTHQHELEKREFQIMRLSEENSRLSQNRDDRSALLEQQIEFLKAQAPAEVSANFDALKRWYAEQLSTREDNLEKCQSALNQEREEYEATLKSKNLVIEQLQAVVKESAATTPSEIGLQSILAPPNELQQVRVENYQEHIREIASKPYSVTHLIKALGHWDLKVRELAAQGLVARGEEAIPPLVAYLERRTPSDYFFWLIGRLGVAYIQRLVSIIHVLTSIGAPAVPQLKVLLSNEQKDTQARALIVLRRINTEQANEILERHSGIVDNVAGSEL